MANLHNLPDFRNLDDQSVLDAFEQSILNPISSNFALWFDDNEAFGAVDITEENLSHFLDAKKPPVQNSTQASPSVSRWINFWTPNKQPGSLGLLAKRYDFSARLLALMETNPPPLQDKVITTDKSQSSWTESFKRRADDYEHHVASSELNEKNEPAADQALNLNQYDIVREIWHFFSVDFGPKYVCIGYNSLYNTGGPSSSKQQLPRKNGSKPAGTRAWAWLVLCEDSMHYLFLYSGCSDRALQILSSRSMKTSIRNRLLGILCS